MEDFLSLSALVPLMISLLAVVVSSLSVKSRIMAEKHFISAVKSQIDDGIVEVPAKTAAASMSKKGSEGFPAFPDDQLLSSWKVLDDHGALTALLGNGSEHSVYRIPPSSTLDKEELRKKYKLIYGALLRYSLNDVNEFSLVRDALYALNESDREKIESTLKNNTSTGRRRYLSTVFRDAMKIAH